MAIKIGTKADKDHYSGRCKRSYIKKYKTEDIEVKNGLWTKIDNDPSLIILWSLLVFHGCNRMIQVLKKIRKLLKSTSVTDLY